MSARNGLGRFCVPNYELVPNLSDIDILRVVVRQSAECWLKGSSRILWLHRTLLVPLLLTRRFLDCTRIARRRLWPGRYPVHINITEGPLLIPVFSLRSVQTCDSSTLTLSPAVHIGLIHLTVTRLGRQEAEASFEERRITLRLKQGTAQLKMESSEVKPVL